MSQKPFCGACALHPDPLQQLIGQSAAMDHVRGQIRRFGTAPIPVLILGETGTGKEVCASLIASLSGRSPTRAINCAAFTETLVESELFGHERGAFTGAVRTHTGVIAAANKGILFLDELEEIPMPVQVKLLRTLESGEYQPVGSSQVKRSDFRLLTATNRDPDELVASGRLRADLLYRLGYARIWLPPLRQRREDIPLLAQEFLTRQVLRGHSAILAIEACARAFLMQQDWPGNVRQLSHVMEAAVAMAGTSRSITVDHLIEVLTPHRTRPQVTERPFSLAEVRQRAERHAILDALRVTEGNRERAATMLDISIATLYRKLAPLDSVAPA